jgi:hypothetical protein
VGFAGNGFEARVVEGIAEHRAAAIVDRDVRPLAENLREIQQPEGIAGDDEQQAIRRQGIQQIPRVVLGGGHSTEVARGPVLERRQYYEQCCDGPTGDAYRAARVRGEGRDAETAGDGDSEKGRQVEHLDVGGVVTQTEQHRGQDQQTRRRASSPPDLRRGDRPPRETDDGQRQDQGVEFRDEQPRESRPGRADGETGPAQVLVFEAHGPNVGPQQIEGRRIAPVRRRTEPRAVHQR